MLMSNSRTCGDCTACCFVAAVDEGIVHKPACQACPFLNHGCRLFGDAKRPQVCSDFQCSWLRGYGEPEDRPDHSGVMLSVNRLNGGTWIMVLDLKKNAHRHSGKNIILAVTAKVNLPVIVVAHEHLKSGRGDFVILPQNLEARAKKIRGEYIESYSAKMNLYRLIITK